jgi:hypothetical protein
MDLASTQFRRFQNWVGCPTGIVQQRPTSTVTRAFAPRRKTCRSFAVDFYFVITFTVERRTAA